MLLVSYARGESASWGVQQGDGVVDLPALAARLGRHLAATLLDHVRSEAGCADLPALLAAATAADPDHLTAVTLPRNQIRLLAPLRPGKIVGVGLNYVEHVEESARSLDTHAALPERPVLFGKPGTAVIGPDQPIRHNGDLTAQLDWECELAVVIGRTARRVSREQALDHVYGYSITNDISARDQRRSGQWFYSKGQDSYAPLGPAVLTADEVPDPQTFDLSLTVNGSQKQSGNSRQMLFTVAELIADISAGMTLEPGDVIATGSPQGVGAAQTPPQFLQPGDVVAATISRIGTLRNPVVDAR
jgi:2-keto-4-pentenoate hydratase/2-oxohepta-3-ene-1,7-dioic acid hydratase in catechol pathway